MTFLQNPELTALGGIVDQPKLCAALQGAVVALLITTGRWLPKRRQDLLADAERGIAETGV